MISLWDSSQGLPLELVPMALFGNLCYKASPTEIPKDPNKIKWNMGKVCVEA
jgi:hypothetical protein